MPNRECSKQPSKWTSRSFGRHLRQPKGETRYELAVEIYKKISVPFSIVAFVLLTVPLGIKRKTEGKFSGVVYSLLIFICYYIISAIMENIGQCLRGAADSRLLCPEHIVLSIGFYLITQLNNEDQGGISQRLRRTWDRRFAKA